MTSPLTFETAPAMWAIERAAGGNAILRIGTRRIPVAAIRAVTREEVADRDVGGLVVMAGAFAFSAAIFVVGVIDIGWRTRFLLGAIILFGLAYMSLKESFGVQPVRYVRLRLALPEGDVVFTTPDRADASALEARIAAEQRSVPATR